MKNIEIPEKGSNDKWLDTAHLRDNLKSRSVASGLSTVTGQIISFVLTTSQTIILARLLVPEEFGMVAMVTAVTGFITTVGNLNLAAAIIQKDNLKQNQLNSLFWMNLVISFLIALLIAAVAPLLVDFYDEKRLLKITFVFALGIFLNGFSIVPDALMKRQMKFKILSIIQLSAVAGSICSGIAMAWLGFGYWAIVWPAVIYPLVLNLGLWYNCDWRPEFNFKLKGAGSLIKFGAGITGFDIVNYYSRNMDNVFIGKFVGPQALGLYSKAYQLLMLPITQLRAPLGSVAIPALSTLQNDPEKFQNYYLKYVFILSFLSMPLIVYLGVYTEELILVVLGKQWMPASEIFRILALAGFWGPVAGTLSLVLTTTGKVKKNFIWGVINAVCNVTAFYIGVKYDGVRGVAIAAAIMSNLLFIPHVYFSTYKSPVNPSLFFKNISFPACVSLAAGAAMWLLKSSFSPEDNLTTILFSCTKGILVGTSTYLLLYYTLPFTRGRLMEVIEIFSNISKRTK